MALRCAYCGKAPVAGNRVSHSNRHTKRRWSPNVQRIKVEVNGQVTRVMSCTRCMRTRAKYNA